MVVNGKKLYFHLGVHPKKQEYYLDAFYNKKYVGYLDFAVNNNNATCGLRLDPNRERLEGLFVNEEHRKKFRGIGRTLVALATRVARENGAKKFDWEFVDAPEVFDTLNAVSVQNKNQTQPSHSKIGQFITELVRQQFIQQFVFSNKSTDLPYISITTR